MSKIQIISDKNSRSSNIKKSLIKILKKNEVKKSNLIIVVGGDGFMLQTLKKYKNSNKKFYGINSGNYGFLIFSDLKFLSEIICILLILVVPSARLELALRKRQGF